ncbi:MAG: hypothetical protein OXC95_02115 [Dehalococcoidia bacterium]|nr:hypothetical protein [Dehalococcoidia bacterium]
MRRVDKTTPYEGAWNVPGTYSSGDTLAVEQRFSNWPSAVYVPNYSGSKVLALELGNGDVVSLTSPAKGRIVRIGDVRRIHADTTIGTGIVFLYQR